MILKEERMRQSCCVLYLSWLSVAGIKTMTRSSAGRKGLIVSYSSQFIPEENQGRKELRAGSGRQERKHRSRRNSAHWLAPWDLLGLLLYTAQDHLLIAGWALLHRSSIKKLSHICAHRSIWWRQFLNWASLLSDGSSLCPVNLEPARWFLRLCSWLLAYMGGLCTGKWLPPGPSWLLSGWKDTAKHQLFGYLGRTCVSSDTIFSTG